MTTEKLRRLMSAPDTLELIAADRAKTDHEVRFRMRICVSARWIA